MRIFLDANILFSAARADGAVRQLLVLLHKSRHSCWVDGFVIEEARRNLAAKSPSGLPELATLLERMHQAPIQPRNYDLESSLPLPEKDRPVLAAAIQAKCQALVTGDRTHFGSLYGKSLHGVKVYTPAGLAEDLL